MTIQKFELIQFMATNPLSCRIHFCVTSSGFLFRRTSSDERPSISWTPSTRRLLVRHVM